MARAEVSVKKVAAMNAGTLGRQEELLTAFDAESREAEFVMGNDSKTIVLLVNEGTGLATFTVLPGNGIQGGAAFVEQMLGNAYSIVCLESGRFKNISGDDKGKVIIRASNTNCKIAVFEAP